MHWIEGSYGWVVSGPKDKDKLKAVASAAYDQLENRTPAAVAGRGRSAHVAARIVRLAVAPLLHQFLELGVAALGQHDADRRIEIACAVLAGQALAFDAEACGPELVPGGMASSTAPSSVGTRTLPPSTAS